MAGVEGGGVEQQDRSRCVRIRPGPDRQVLEQGATIAFRGRKEAGVEQLCQALAGGVIAGEHARIVEAVGESQDAQVALHCRQELHLQFPHQLPEGIWAGLQAVSARALQQLLDLEVIESADDRPAGDRGNHRDMAQQVAFRQPRQHPDMEQRRPEAATGQGEAELAGARFSQRQCGSGRMSHGIALRPVVVKSSTAGSARLCWYLYNCHRRH